MDPIVQRDILDGEHALIRAQIDADSATVQALLSDAFREIGSSGRYFGKSAVLDSLTRSMVLHFHVQAKEWIPVSADCVILVYLAEVTRQRGSRIQTVHALRSSTWRREQGAWRLLFHQATPNPSPAPAS